MLKTISAIKKNLPGMTVHTWNSSYSGGLRKEDGKLEASLGNLARLSLKIKFKKQDRKKGKLSGSACLHAWGLGVIPNSGGRKGGIY